MAIPTRQESGVSEGPSHHDDGPLTDRIVAAYAIALRNFPGYGKSMWSSIGNRSLDVHKLLLGDQVALAAALRNPHTTELFYEFDGLTRTTYAADVAPGDTATTRLTYMTKHLARLAAATGAIRLPYPEAPRSPFPASRICCRPRRAPRFCRRLPNPYPFEGGLRTSRGVAGLSGPPGDLPSLAAVGASRG